MVRGKKPAPVEEEAAPQANGNGGNDVEELMVSQGQTLVQLETLLKELRRSHKLLERHMAKLNRPPKAAAPTPRKKRGTSADLEEQGEATIA